jgi:hypothetical protein
MVAVLFGKMEGESKPISLAIVPEMNYTLYF